MVDSPAHQKLRSAAPPPLGAHGGCALGLQVNHRFVVLIIWWDGRHVARQVWPVPGRRRLPGRTHGTDTARQENAGSDGSNDRQVEAQSLQRAGGFGAAAAQDRKLIRMESPCCDGGSP